MFWLLWGRLQLLFVFRFVLGSVFLVVGCVLFSVGAGVAGWFVECGLGEGTVLYFVFWLSRLGWLSSGCA